MKRFRDSLTYPKALRTLTSRVLDPKTILKKAFGPFRALGIVLGQYRNPYSRSLSIQSSVRSRRILLPSQAS